MSIFGIPYSLINDLLMIHDFLAHTFISSIQSTATPISSSVSSQPRLRRSVPNHRPLHRNKPQDNPTVVKGEEGSNPNKLVTVRIHGLRHKASFNDSGTVFSRTIKVQPETRFGELAGILHEQDSGMLLVLVRKKPLTFNIMKT